MSTGARFRRRLLAVVTILTAALVVAGTVTAVRMLAKTGKAPAATREQPVAVHPVGHRAVKLPAMRTWRRPRTRWPATGTGTAMISASTSTSALVLSDALGPVRADALLMSSAAASSAGAPEHMPGGPTKGSATAGALPVQVGPPASSAPVTPMRRKTKASQIKFPRYRDHGRRASRPRGAPAPPRSGIPGGMSSVSAPSRPSGVTPAGTRPVASARVRVLPHQVAVKLGVTGAVFTVARADGSAAPGRVHVSFGYSGFRDAFGGNYASRLHLAELPACALTTPAVPSCRVQTPLVSGNDVKTSQAGADVILPGTAAASAAAITGQAGMMLTAATAHVVVLAVTAAAQGSGR